VAARKAEYDDIVRRIRESPFGQEHYPIPKSVFDVSPDRAIAFDPLRPIPLT
jgi:cyclohexanone monooxygenase